MTRMILKATGARVNSVDEEGEVSLFLYSWGRSYTFNVGGVGAKEWGARIGDLVTVQILAEEYKEPGRG